MELLSSKFVFDGEELLSNKAIVIHNNTVKDISSKKVLEKVYSLKVKDFGEGVLLPGFVNLHTHLELSYLKNKLPQKKGFVEWLSSIMYEKTKDVDNKEIAKNIENAVETQFKSGVRIIADISNTLASCEYLKKYMPYSTIFFEQYGLNKEKACKIKKNLEEKLNNYKKMCGQLKLIPTAHSLYSTHSCLIEYLIGLSKQEPFSIHFLESSFEKDFLISRGDMFDFLNSLGLVEETIHYPDVFDYIKKLGISRRKTIFVHCTYADKNELENIKRTDSTVCLCLRSNKYISEELPDIHSIIKSGVNIGVGTDSLASNWDLDFINELKFIYGNFSDINPNAIFKWATTNGAKALGLNLGFKKDQTAFAVFLPSSDNNPLEEILSQRRGISNLRRLNID